MSTTGDRIRSLRLRLGMSVKDLATLSGLSRETIVSAERGGRVREASIDRMFEALKKAFWESGLADDETAGDQAELEIVVFNVLADYTSDLDYVSEVGAKLVAALRESGLLRP